MTRGVARKFDPNLPAVQAAIDELERAIGGRQALVEALIAGPRDDDIDYVLGLVADPRHDDHSLSTLCDMGNITPEQLLRAYKQVGRAKSQILAIDQVNKQLPAVVSDVMRRAVNHHKLCYNCAGKGTTWSRANGETTCETCRGEGQLLTDASLDHQRLALDMGGLLQKGGGGIQIAQINQTTGQETRVASGLLPFAQLQLAVQRVLHPPAQALPAELPEPQLDAEPLDGEVL